MRYAGQKPESLEERLEKRIARKRGDVFLREDFGDLGGYDQVGRALRKLVRKGQLMKAGYGIYARTRPSLARRQADADQRHAGTGRRSSRRASASKPCRRGMERHYNAGKINPGADRPRDRRPRAGAPPDQLQRSFL